ncbi:MAG: NADPH-dependent F420 reductase, partial [Anaerolineae bacterium]
MMVTVAVLGGTGKEGSGLAMRWAQSGYRVIVGSRDAERAKSKATEFNEILGESLIEGAHNQEAAARADIVVLTVPYDAHQATLESV